MLDATLSMPETAQLGVPITMTVTTTNPHEKAVMLDSIDIGDSFLEGFRVSSVQPAHNSTVHIFGMRSWDFSTAVQPGQSLEVVFELTPVMAGHFAGDVDVCNPSQDYHTLVADVVVHKDAPPATTQAVE